jgi:thermopsin
MIVLLLLNYNIPNTSCLNPLEPASIPLTNQPSIIDILEYQMSLSYAPTGIASYGVYNNSGSLSYYIIKTNQIIGYFNISSIKAYNSTFPDHYVASLQLNVVLQIVTSTNNYSLWLQNVIVFITNESSFYFINNIWNFTEKRASINPNSIDGNGNIYRYKNIRYYALAYPENELTYSLPLAGYLIINISKAVNRVEVSFGYAILQNGSKVVPFNINYYDKVSIYSQSLLDAYIFINPYNLTGSGHAYNAELVFGGGYGGEVTNFISLSAQLALLYNTSSGIKPFPSLYTFGVNTAEAATNLQVGLSSNGNAYVTVGKRNYNILTNSFSPSIPGFSYIEVYIQVVSLKVSLIDYKYFNSPYYINPPSIINLNSTSKLILLKVIINYDNQNFTVNLPFKIDPIYLKKIVVYILYKEEVLITIHYPNGTSSNWYDRGSVIVLPKIIKLNDSVRYFLNSSNSLIITYPIEIYPNYVKQYYIVINLPNGKISDWVNSNTYYNLPKFIYINNYTRFMLNTTSILITKPGVYNLSFTKQYLVIINYPNGTVANWYNEGSTLRLYYPNLFFQNVRFLGTYNVSNDYYVNVTKPIIESVVIELNLYPILIIGVLIIIIITIIIIIRKK